MILPRRELEAFLVALALPKERKISAEDIRRRILKKYDISLSRKRVQDILQAVKNEELIQSVQVKRKNWKRHLYGEASEPRSPEKKIKGENTPKHTDPE